MCRNTNIELWHVESYFRLKIPCIVIITIRDRNLKISKAPLKSQAHQGTSLFTSAATNQRGFHY